VTHGQCPLRRADEARASTTVFRAAIEVVDAAVSGHYAASKAEEAIVRAARTSPHLIAL